MKSLITTSIFAVLFSIGSSFGTKPLFKQLIISNELVDSTAKTITKNKMYSYFIVDVDGGYGTYTSEEIYSFSGELIKQLFVKENVLVDEMSSSHIIWSKLIKYQFGKVIYINVTKRISDSFVVLKDVSYHVTPSRRK